MTQPPEEVIFSALDALDPKGNGLTPWQATLAALDVLLEHGYRVVPADSTVLTVEEAKLLMRYFRSGGAPNGTAWPKLYDRIRELSSQHTEEKP